MSRCTASSTRAFGYTSTDKGYGEDVNKFDMRSSQNSSNRFGVKGEEDLGNGVKVGFSLENGFSSDDGKLSTADRPLRP